MGNDIELFDGKTFQDLTKDIYENSKNKKLQLELLIQEVHGFITSIDDIVMVGPIIKELMDVSVKNDEHLVKLASVFQRIITRSQSGSDEDSLGLSEHEKEELIQTLQETANDLQKESDKIESIEVKKQGFIES
tara:strand:+ start:560 stop:961 length:402 start_codon:yes stop_codon:yes gene_type:complete